MGFSSTGFGKPPQSVAKAGQKLETLEALRAVAVLLVVLYHLQVIAETRLGTSALGGLFGAGGRGVDLFFVLSGYIITITHARDAGSSARVLPYLYRRACRIFPSVWILTVLAAITYAFYPYAFSQTGKLNPWNVGAGLLLLPQQDVPLINVTWTLTYEMFFYSLFAVLMVSRRTGIVVMVAWQLSVAIAATGLLKPANWIAAYYLNPLCNEFGIGILSALATKFLGLDSRLPRHMLFAILAVGAATFLGSLLYEGLSHAFLLEPARVAIYGLASGSIIVALTALEHSYLVKDAWSAGVMRRASAWIAAILVELGHASYAIYLVNYGVMTLTAVALANVAGIRFAAVAIPICFVLAIAAGVAFHTWVDQPIQKHLRHLGRTLFARNHMPQSRPVPQPRL